MSVVDRLLLKLDQAISPLESPQETVHVWMDVGETEADVLARQFPDGVPRGVIVKAYRWADPASAPATKS